MGQVITVNRMRLKDELLEIKLGLMQLSQKLAFCLRAFDADRKNHVVFTVKWGLLDPNTASEI